MGKKEFYHNTIDDKIQYYNTEINNLDKLRKEIFGQTQWFDSANIIKIKNDLINYQNKLSNEEKDLLNFKNIKLEKESDITALEKQVPNVIISIFSKKKKEVRKKLKNKINLIKNELDIIDKENENLTTINNQTKAELINIEIDYNLYIKLEKKDVKKELERVTIKLSENIKEFEFWNSEYNRLSEFCDPLYITEREIKNINDDISNLKSFIKELSYANNSYERKLIHEECEKKYGYGNPNNLLSKFNKKLNALNTKFNNQYESLVHFMQKEKEKNILKQKIKTIVIDGSNLCYESGNKKIGPLAVSMLTQKLCVYYNIIVIFDNNLFLDYGLQNMTEEYQEKIFGKNVKVHKVQSGRKADDILLEYAEKDDSCFIISNDKFRDNSSYEAVFYKRVIRHEIVAGKLIISELDINLSYE